MAEASASESKPSDQPRNGAETRPSVAVVGAGTVGTALAQRLQAAGYPIAAILSRSPRPARELAAEVGASCAATSLHALPQRVRMLFLCVPDDQVRVVAERLAGHPHPWKHCLVAHTSGALPAAALRPLAAQGATPLSFHPLQAFAQGAAADAFDGIYVALEGEAEALTAGRGLAEALAVETLELTAESKARYHLAASMASNFLVTLLAMAGEVLDDAVSQGIDRGEGADWLRPLVEGTLHNLKENPPETALTGPVARGDEETVAAHLEALHQHHPGFVPVYAALATEAVRLAARADRLPSATADRLLQQFTEVLERPNALRP